MSVCQLIGGDEEGTPFFQLFDGFFASFYFCYGYGFTISEEDSIYAGGFRACFQLSAFEDGGYSIGHHLLYFLMFGFIIHR